MGTSKKELCAGSIYYMCMLFGIEGSILKEQYINKMYNNLLKLEYDEVLKIFNDLKGIYKENYIY